MGTGAGGNFGNTKGSRSNAKIHKGRQDKHIVGTNNYKQQIANGKHPSILTENPLFGKSLFLFLQKFFLLYCKKHLQKSTLSARIDLL